MPAYTAAKYGPKVVRGFEKWVESLVKGRDLPKNPRWQGVADTVPVDRPSRRYPTDPIGPKMEKIFEEAYENVAGTKAARAGLNDPLDLGGSRVTPAMLEALQKGGHLRRQEEIFKALPYMRAGGAAVGGYLGQASTDDPEEKWKRGILGAVAGGVVVPGAVQATALGKTGADKLSNYLFYSYLSSPDTITRANLGAMGGIFNHLFEQAAIGVFARGAKGVQAQRNAIETIKALPEAGRIWKQTLLAPEKKVRQIRQSIFGSKAEFDYGMGQLGQDAQQRFRDVGLGRFFSAGDNAAVHALTRGGMPVQDAMRYTLAGMPETPMGQKVVGFTQGLLRDPSIGKRFIGATVAPFARVGVVGMEQGLKRMPGIGQMKWTGGDQALKTARQLMGTSAGVGGYLAEGGEESVIPGVDPRLTQALGTITGPAFLPFQMGRELRAAGKTESELLPQLQTGVGQTFREFNPMGFQPLGIFQRPLEETLRRSVPSGMRDIAEAMDPAFGRSGGLEDVQQAGMEGALPSLAGLIPGAGGVIGSIPGLRERLPERFDPVDWQGQPLYSDAAVSPPDFLKELPFIGPGVEPGADILNKVMFPARQQFAPPAFSVDPWQRSSLTRDLASVGVEPGAPSGKVSLHPLLGDLPATPQTAAQTQQFRGTANTLAANVLQQYLPLLERMPPAMRERWARWLFNRIKAPMNPIMRTASMATTLAGQPRQNR
jgi:hypothetical protein